MATGFQTVRPTGGATPAYATQRAGNTGTWRGAGSVGGGTLGRAVQGAVGVRDALGIPSYQDLFKQFGSGEGGATVGGLYEDKEYGNRDTLKQGADFAKGELTGSKAGLVAQQSNINRARGAIRNPTNTAGFQNTMRLASERLNRATESERQQASEAASRRGFVGGYSGEQSDRDRLEAMGMVGAESAAKEREAQTALLGQETGLYGQELGQYGGQLDAYTKLLDSYGTTPTKSRASNLQGNPLLDLYGKLAGGSGFGDIFGTALRGAQYDDEATRTARGHQEARADQLRQRQQQQSDQRRLAGGSGSFRGY